MEYIWIIFALFAAVALAPMVVYVLPFSIDKKLNPAVMFLSALSCLVLPHLVVLALALTVPMGLVYGFTGVRLQGHEPVKLPVEQVKTLAKNIKVPKKTEVREFLKTSFPDPGGHVESYVPPL